MSMIDFVGEGTDKYIWLYPLPKKVAGVKVESECTSVIQHLQQFPGSENVISNFSSVNFEGKFDSTAVEFIEYG